MENISPNYQDLLKVKAGENHGRMLVLNNYYPQGIVCAYEQFDMNPWLGDNLLVRSGVAQRLKHAAKLLSKIKPGYKFLVVYAYRHPIVQKKYFLRQRKLLAVKNKLDDFSLDALTHNFVAVPKVAGHTCGAALDLTLIGPKGVMDMGTAIADFKQADKIPTYSYLISSAQKKNRLLLRSVMAESGFAPFDGEWWHFSYGDREWAYYYKRLRSLYSPIMLTKRKNYSKIT